MYIYLYKFSLFLLHMSKTEVSASNSNRQNAWIYIPYIKKIWFWFWIRPVDFSLQLVEFSIWKGNLTVKWKQMCTLHFFPPSSKTIKHVIITAMLISSIGQFVLECGTSGGRPEAAAARVARSCHTALTPLHTVKQRSCGRTWYHRDPDPSLQCDGHS